MDHKESPGRTTTEEVFLPSVWASATAGDRASITDASITARVAPKSAPPLLLSLKLKSFPPYSKTRFGSCCLPRLESTKVEGRAARVSCTPERRTTSKEELAGLVDRQPVGGTGLEEIAGVPHE